MATDSVHEFLESALTGRFPSATFENKGDAAAGTIVGVPKVLETQYGTRLLIDLDQGGGNGVTVWVKPGAMATAVAKAAGADGLAEGGKLAIVFTDELDTGKGNPAKLYEARYEPPKAAVDVNSIFGDAG